MTAPTTTTSRESATAPGGALYDPNVVIPRSRMKLDQRAAFDARTKALAAKRDAVVATYLDAVYSGTYYTPPPAPLWPPEDTPTAGDPASGDPAAGATADGLNPPAPPPAPDGPTAPATPNPAT